MDAAHRTRRRPWRAGSAIALALVALLHAATAGAAIATQPAPRLIVAFTANANSVTPGTPVVWTIKVTASGATFDFVWADYTGPAGVCSPACEPVKGKRVRFAHGPLASGESFTAEVTIDTTAMSGYYIASATIQASPTDFWCDTSCFIERSLAVGTQPATATLKLSPDSGPGYVAGSPGVRTVDFKATYTYLGFGCPLTATINWDASRQVYPFSWDTSVQVGCVGTTTVTFWPAAPGQHKTCAGATSKEGALPAIACATYTVTGSSTPKPTSAATPTPPPKPSIAPSPTAEPTPDPTPSPSPTPSASPTPSETAAPTDAPTPAATASPATSALPAVPVADESDPSGAAILIVLAAVFGVALGGVGLWQWRGPGGSRRSRA